MRQFPFRAAYLFGPGCQTDAKSPFTATLQGSRKHVSQGV